MLNFNFYKKIPKLLISINKILESFFIELEDLDIKKIKATYKEKLIDLDHKFESFFNKFKEFKKYNQSKKKLSFFENKAVLSITIISLLFLTYFFIPVFYNEGETKNFLKNQINKSYEIEIKFNEKVKYGLLPKPYFYTKNLNIIHDDKILGNSIMLNFISHLIIFFHF